MLVLLNYIIDEHESYLVTITIVINLKSKRSNPVKQYKQHKPQTKTYRQYPDKIQTKSRQDPGKVKTRSRQNPDKTIETKSRHNLDKTIQTRSRQILDKIHIISPKVNWT